MPTESQKLQILIQDRAPSTKRKYLGQLATIQRGLGGDVELATWGQLLYFLNHVPNPHTRHTYINIISHLRRDLAADMTDLRLDNHNYVRDHVAHVNSLREPPTFKELCRRRDEAYHKGEWASFLVQALTIQYGVRTADLEMWISDRENRDTTKNHLIRYPGKVEWVRNRYKTVSHYRAKTHVIQDPRIIQAANRLPSGLFTAKLVDCHPDRTGQADYFRAQVEHLVDNDPSVLQKIQALAESRGSSWTQVVTHYNLRMNTNL